MKPTKLLLLGVATLALVLLPRRSSKTPTKDNPNNHHSSKPQQTHPLPKNK